jgi:hypothetical protein
MSLIDNQASENSFVYCGGILGGRLQGGTPSTIYTGSVVSISETFFGGDIVVENFYSGAIGGIAGGGIRSNTGYETSLLTIETSVFLGALIKTGFGEIPTDQQKPKLGRGKLAGQRLKTGVGNTNNFSATPATVDPIYVTPLEDSKKAEGIDGRAQARSLMDITWYGNQPGFGGIGWDVNSTWKWNPARGAPAFQWE